MSKRPEHWDGWFTVSEAERMLGLSHGALAHFIDRHKRNIQTHKNGKHRMVSMKGIDAYERLTHRPGVERVAARPRGWVGVEKAAALLDSSLSFVWTSARRGDIQAVRVGYTNFYDPATCKALKERIAPPVGWLALKQACGAADTDGAAAWMRKQGHPTGLYMHPEVRQLALYGPPVAVTQWREYIESYNRGRRLTYEQAQEIRASHTAGESRAALARRYGVHLNSIRQIVLGMTYKEVA